MKRTDRIKLDFTRNWKLPGKERLSRWLKPSQAFKQTINRGIVWLGAEDIAIYTGADSYIEWAILSNGTYEEEINKLIRISLKDGENALDIGGNIGLQSIRMSQAVGKTGKVLAFEPLGYLREKFIKNIGLNKTANVTLLPFALSDEESEADFIVDKKSWNQGTFSLSNKMQGDDKERVTIKIGDGISEIQSLASLSLIKIDVEGFEFQVIRGLLKTIERLGPRIIFEYDENYWRNNNQDLNDCYSLLRSLNYTFYQITSVGCEPIRLPGEIVGGNLFCIREKQ